ncbi:relaxase/mobilization nuclease domain-containing protein (plasmid) [Kineococcus sp. DHX-1]|uniref:relaxase/mobilization nuclease domain-containing protein n=1 Tax=Kineococcus sp. DHX-1 TaxID=3349638 RepID=UPI0036D35F56
MIAKATRGSQARDLAAYLHGPGTKEEHVYAGRAGGAVIGGNLGLEGSRDGTTWAALLNDAARMRRDIVDPIWHTSLRCAPGDRTLTDAEWAEAASLFGETMGFIDSPGADVDEQATQPWVVVRHGEDHVHLAVSRVGHDGRVWHARNDYRQAQAACALLEQTYGLQVAPKTSTKDTKRAPDHQLSAGEWRRGQRTGATPERVQLAERVRAAVDAAAGTGRNGFEVALQRADVGYRANVAGSGRVSGYSFTLPGHVDKDGEAVWFRASQLDRALAWSKVAPVLETPVAAPRVEVAKKMLETTARHERRVEAAQAEAVAQQSAQRLEVLPQVIAARVEGDDRWWQLRRRGGEQVETAIVERARQDAHLEELHRLSQVAFPFAPGQGRGASQRQAKDAARAATQARPNRSVSDLSRDGGRDDDRGR